MTQRPVQIPIRSVISANYAELSEALRVAADYVAENQIEVATRSLRSVASASGVSPASFTRLARALGFNDYESLRDRARGEIARQTTDFKEKARQLRDNPDLAQLPRQAEACMANIQELMHGMDQDELDAAVETIAAARRVFIVGGLSSAGFADYFGYLANWFADKWTVTGRNGISLASALASMTNEDAVIVISMAPHAHRSVRTAEMAAGTGARVIAITDSFAFPGLKHTHHSFVVRTGGPHFFSSYAAPLVLIETITGMLVARAGPSADARIQEVDRQNRLLDEFEKV